MVVRLLWSLWFPIVVTLLGPLDLLSSSSSSPFREGLNIIWSGAHVENANDLFAALKSDG